jgi:hypothetical protein
MRTKTWTATVALAALLMVGLGGAQSAQAQAPRFGPPVAMTGNAGGQQAFRGTFTPQRFVASAGKLYAVGTLRGTVRNRRVSRTVRIPAAVVPGAPTATASQVTPPIPPTPNACQVLSLVLGPLDLNLLGLRIRLNQVRLLIEAVPSGGGTGGQPGGLLGDLLCGITNLLNPSAATPPNQVVRLLDALLALSR